MEDPRKLTGLALIGMLALTACGGTEEQEQSDAGADRSDHQETYEAWGEALHEGDGETVCSMSFAREDARGLMRTGVDEQEELLSPISSDETWMEECLTWVDESSPQDQENAFDPSVTLDYSEWSEYEDFLTTSGDDHMYRIDGEWFVQAPTSMQSSLTELVDPPDLGGPLDNDDVNNEWDS